MKNRVCKNFGSAVETLEYVQVSGPNNFGPANLVAKRGLPGTESHLSELGRGEANRGQTGCL